MIHALEVSSGNREIGVLTLDTSRQRFGFCYHENWLHSGDFLLSPRLTPEACQLDSIHHELSTFLGNLLPEGQSLDDVAAAARVSRQNLFGLLRYLGRETAGALCFREPGSHAPDSLHSLQRVLPFSELSERIQQRDQLPFSVWDGKVRLSIAGYQDKIAVFREGKQLWLVDGALASTHILKPPPRQPALQSLVINEFFCMRLAKALGLPVAEVDVWRIPEPVLLIQRFDRVAHQGSVQRLHIIDACQALGLPASYKYERNLGNTTDVRHIREGVSLPRLFELSSLSHQKALTRLALLRWTLFQYLIGNADAHGKNFSFFVRGDALYPAPAYDLVCVEIHPEFEHEAAMAIGDTFNYPQLGAFDWAQFASECGLNRPLVAREMRRIAQQTLTTRATIDDLELLPAEQDYLNTLTAFIQQRARTLLSMAAEIPRIPADYL